MAAGIPGWFDLDVLRGIVIALTIASGFGVLVALAFVRNLVVKVGLALALLAAAGGLLYYRTQLDDCEKTCTCRFVIDDLPTDGCPR
jgi:hypothetical protein